MIVFYDNPNILSLPYTLDGIQRYFDFVPGKNEIHPEVWKAISACNKERLDNHYSQFLRVFNPMLERVPPSAENELPLEIEVGKENFAFHDLTVQQALDLVQNTMAIDELHAYKDAENSQKRPRKVVLNTIDSRIAEISELDKKIKEAQ
ncbi:MAG: hypothetical protein AB1847_19490 [bacterium]